MQSARLAEVGFGTERGRTDCRAKMSRNGCSSTLGMALDDLKLRFDPPTPPSTKIIAAAGEHTRSEWSMEGKESEPFDGEVITKGV